VPLAVGPVVHCADNSGASSICLLSKTGRQDLPAVTVSDLILVTVKKGKSTLRKKVMCGVLVRQNRHWRRRDGTTVCFDENAGVIINDKGELKGSAIKGPVARECAEFWPKLGSVAATVI
jgi:large subunit ribosomal protein L23e